MEVVGESGLVPDLAEAPQIGRGKDDFPQGVPVEAAIGERQVLTIIHRIDRASPNNVIPTVLQVTDALYGPQGMADYYDKVSDGRFGLVNAGVLEYDTLKSEDHYWNHDQFDCGAPQEDGFAGGHGERWAEAITLASADVDFASFDVDNDGTVSANELAILIVVPQATPRGFTRALDVFCDGGPLVLNGVVLPEMSEWFTNTASTWEIPTHELAHQIFGLGDLYSDSINFDTEAGTLSLMGDNLFTKTHVDAVYKLALGWVTPLYAPFGGTYELEDVKVSGEVGILPRASDGDGKEFFVLENRQTSFNNPLYDTATGATGIVVWHIVEDPTLSANPPACMTPAEWGSVTSNARRGMRVIRPSIDFASAGPSTWDSQSGDLPDSGLVCPGEGIVQNALLFADGSASGFAISNFSASAAVMDFDLDVP